MFWKCNLDVAGQRKTIVRKAAQFITQPLFFTKEVEREDEAARSGDIS